MPIDARSVASAFATCRAASAVEFATSRSAWPSLPANQVRHCPNGLGCDTTTRTSASVVPGRAQRCNDTGRSTSRWMSRSVSNANVSSVTVTVPSIEFSIGTSPISTSPRSTAVRTSGTVRNGTAVCAARSGWLSSASSANVPRGPRYPTRVTDDRS